MYQTLLFAHSLFRWLVLLSLIYALFRAIRGYRSQLSFTKADNSVRHWTATIAHIQLMLGILLYTQSPVVKQYFAGTDAQGITEPLFFGIIHISMMLIAIILLTVGSAKTKRAADDREKFRKMLLWYAIALTLILLAVPWPFSPFAARPYLR